MKTSIFGKDVEFSTPEELLSKVNKIRSDRDKNYSSIISSTESVVIVVNPEIAKGNTINQSINPDESMNGKSDKGSDKDPKIEDTSIKDEDLPPIIPESLPTDEVKEELPPIDPKSESVDIDASGEVTMTLLEDNDE